MPGWMGYTQAFEGEADTLDNMIEVQPNPDHPNELTIELYSNLSMSLDRFFASFMLISGATLLVALYPLLLGLWPVMVVALIHVALIGLCFRSAWRGNWARQIIHFGPETVTIRHLTVKDTWSLEWPVTWLRLGQRLDRQGQIRLYLDQHGIKQEIGGFLPSCERDQLRALVKQALDQRTGWVSQSQQQMVRS